jgi:hypothetical protein
MCLRNAIHLDLHVRSVAHYVIIRRRQDRFFELQCSAGQNWTGPADVLGFQMLCTHLDLGCVGDAVPAPGIRLHSLPELRHAPSRLWMVSSTIRIDSLYTAVTVPNSRSHACSIWEQLIAATVGAQPCWSTSAV